MKAKPVKSDDESRRRHDAIERIVLVKPCPPRPIPMNIQANPAPREHLTPRQLEVLWLLCEGLPNKLISRRLKISGGTVKTHISSLLRALNVSSRVQVVVAARRMGLAPAPETEDRHVSSRAGQPGLVHLSLDANDRQC